MALYFFETDSGHGRFRDDIGTELAYANEARDEATRAMAELAKEYHVDSGRYR